MVTEQELDDFAVGAGVSGDVLEAVPLNDATATSTADDEVDEEETLVAAHPMADDAPARWQWDCGLREFFRRLVRVYTLRFLCLLLAIQMLLKGCVYVVVQSGFFPIMKGLGEGAERVQVWQNVAMSPWSLKPVFGSLSDMVVLGSVHKKWWLVLALAVGIAASTSMALLDAQGALLAWFVAVCFFGVSYCVAWSDLLSEAKYSEIVRDKQEGSAVITFINGAQRVGYVASFGLIGPLVSSNHTALLMVLVAGACGIILVPTLLGFMPEERRLRSEPGLRGNRFVMLDVGKARANWKMLVVVLLSGLAAPFMSLVPAVFPGRTGLIVGMCIFGAAACGLIVAAYVLFPSRYIAIIAAYEVSKRMGRLELSSALDFFYTADQQCCPGCPSFSMTFYVTVLGIVGSLTGLAAVFIYQRWLSDWPYRRVCAFTALLSAMSAATDVFIVMRWNVLVGIPDSLAVLTGDAVLQPIATMLAWLPGSLLLSKACPPGLESSVFAFLAGVSNVALFGSGLAGALVMNVAGLQTVAPCQFGGLAGLVLVCHALLPIVVNIPVVLLLLPNTKQSEKLE